MPLELALAYGTAFIAAFGIVVVFAMGVNDFLKVRDRQWAMLRATNDSLLDTINALMRDVLYEGTVQYAFIERMTKNVRVNLGRAGLPNNAKDWVSGALYEGFLAAIVLSLVLGLLIGLGGVILGVAAGAGWALWIKPSMLDADGEQRSRIVYRRIPYALDLSVLVLETGGTLREGLEEIAQHDDPMAEEIRVALKEIDSGSTQAAALKGMARRVGLESLETIVLAINRGEETGAPMVNTLVMQAEMFRERRLQEVEKLAVEAPAKMTFPNMMIMFAVLLLIVGPLIIQLTDSGMF